MTSLDSVPRETHTVLERLIDEIDHHGATQNLIAAASRPDIWTRHIQDSLQLLPLAPDAGTWLDIGTGAGFPGLVVAIAGARDLVLVEPRRLRATFLVDVVKKLGLSGRVEVAQARVETIQRAPFDVISARAVASLDGLFAAAEHLAHDDTVWLLPKGRKARDELAAALQTWQGRFTLVPSITDPEASIVVARRVQRRAKR